MNDESLALCELRTANENEKVATRRLWNGTLATHTIVHFFGQATMSIIQSNFTREEEQLRRGGGEEGRTDGRRARSCQMHV